MQEFDYHEEGQTVVLQVLDLEVFQCWVILGFEIFDPADLVACWSLAYSGAVEKTLESIVGFR